MLPWLRTVETSGRTSEATRPTPQPIRSKWDTRGPRRWHLTPWKKTGLMDELLDDTSGTGGWDIVNNLITQAGNVFSTRNGGIVTVPRPGQIVPYGSPVPGTTFGVSNSLLLAGAAIAGAFLIMRKK